MSNIIVYIRSRNFFGSQIVCYPVLYQLRKIFPNETIGVVGQDDLASFYTILPWVSSYSKCSSFLDMYRQIQPQTHTVITLHPSSERYALASVLGRVRTRVGFRNNRLLDFSWTHSCEVTNNEYIGLANCNLLCRYQPFDPQHAARASILELGLLCQHEVPSSDVVLMPGGGAGMFKRWKVQNFISLIPMLDSILGADTTFTFVLGKSEQAEARFLQQHLSPKIRLLVSRPVFEIASVCAKAKLVISNDCGPSHLAQMSGVPYVGIFFKENPRWFWARKNTRAVLPDLSTDDIQTITPGRVLDACKAVLA